MVYILDEQYQQAEKRGITKKNVYQRVYEYGWEVERAITEPVHHLKDDIEWRKKWKVVALPNGITYGVFANRILYGWDPHTAATHPLIESKDDPSQWERWKETADSNGVCRSTYRGRVYRGWTFEEAATKPPANTGRKR